MIVMVFARAPVAGQCKTRLMPRHGAHGAARWHQQLVKKTLAVACASGYPVELWCAPDSRHGFFLACRRRWGLRLRRQARGDLGRKMGRALHGASAAGTGALLVGTDCAALTPADLHQAALALHTHDAVLQPASDGGYVLIGARKNIHGALRGVDWSSGRELGQTRRRLHQRHFSFAELSPLWDVDHPADLRKARQLGLLNRADC